MKSRFQPRNILKKIIWSRSAQASLSFIILILLWEFAVKVLSIRPYILPAPSEVLKALFAFSDHLAAAAVYTSRSIVLGYLTAILSGVLLALPVAFSRFMQRAVYPILVVSQIVPKVALAPIFVIWFGFGLLPKVTIVFLLSFFPVVLNGIVGLRSLDPDIVNLTRSTGARAIDVFFRVRLPAALPNFFAGFKLAAISAAVGAIIGEFIGSDAGLGFIILTANGDMRTDYSFAAIAVLTLLGLILYYVVEFLERLLLPWHVSQRIETAAS